MAFCTSSCPTTGAPPSPSCSVADWSKGRSKSLNRLTGPDGFCSTSVP